MIGCRKNAAAPPKPGSGAQQQPPEVAVIPSEVQLVRTYHGKIERRDGSKAKLLLQVTTAAASPAGVRFKYTLNAPDRREDDSGPHQEGVLDPTGRITFAGFTGRARMDGGNVVLESVGIEGPPYWHLVGRAPRGTHR